MPALWDGLSGLPQSPGRLSSRLHFAGFCASTFGIFLWKEHFIRGTALSQELAGGVTAGRADAV